MHLLIFLHQDDKIHNADQVDALVSANFLIQLFILFSIILLPLACFMVPVEMISQMHLAWSMANAASIIPKIFQNIQFMVRMAILSMPGPTMDPALKRMVSNMIIGMWFHIIPIFLLSKSFFL